jgi:hypothetical protein
VNQNIKRITLRRNSVASEFANRPVFQSVPHSLWCPCCHSMTSGLMCSWPLDGFITKPFELRVLKNVWNFRTGEHAARLQYEVTCRGETYMIRASLGEHKVDRSNQRGAAVSRDHCKLHWLNALHRSFSLLCVPWAQYYSVFHNFVVDENMYHTMHNLVYWPLPGLCRCQYLKMTNEQWIVRDWEGNYVSLFRILSRNLDGGLNKPSKSSG